MKNKIALFSICGMLLAHSAYPQLLLNVTHQSGINSLSINKDSSIAASCGNDGKVKLFNTRSSRITMEWSFPYPVLKTAMHPVKNQLAVFRQNADSYLLEIYDYSENRLIKSFSFSDAAVNMDFSPKGSLLAVSTAEWTSLTVIDTASWTVREASKSIRGIISAFSFSATEKTIMAYFPAGSVQYFDTDDFRKKGEVKIESGLSHPSFMQSQRHMAGLKDDNFLVFDIVNGSLSYMEKLPAPAVLAAAPDKNSAAVLIQNSSGNILKKFDFSTSQVSPAVKTQTSAEKGTVNLLVYSKQEMLFSAEAFTSIIRYTAASASVIADYPLMEIKGAALNSSRELYVHTESEVFKFQTQYPADYRTLQLSGFLQLYKAVSAQDIIKGLDITADPPFLFSTYSLGKIRSLNPQKKAPQESVITETPLKAFNNAAARGYITDNGSLFITDALDGKLLYSENKTNIKKAVFIDNTKILALSAAQFSRTAEKLLLINMETGETVPLNINPLRIHDFAWDNKNRLLYSLETIIRNSQEYRVIKIYSGLENEADEVLYAEKEDSGPAFLEFINSMLVYKSGTEVKLFDGNSFSPFSDTVTGPAAAAENTALFTAPGTDGSISVFSVNSSRAIGKLYIFRDKNWFITDGQKILQQSAQASKYFVLN